MSYGWDRGRVKTTPGRPSIRYSDLRASAVVPEQSAPSSRLRRVTARPACRHSSRCGGITVVQDPSDAAIPEMPDPFGTRPRRWALRACRALREEFGQSILHVDIRPLSEVPFQAEAILRPLTGLRMLSLRGSPMHLQRAQTNLADSDESIGMIVNFTTSKISQRGRNVVLGPGEAIALLHAEPAAVTYASGSHLALVLPRDALASRVKDIDSATMRLIPRHSEALRLLVSYLRLVLEKAVLATPELREAVVTHVHDLVAISLGEPTPVGESSASAVVAARLAAALDRITSSFQDPELSLATVACDLHISPRYLQRLLETSGTSFTACVNELRLQRAFALLTEARDGERRISDVALQVGFSDISHFNRLFHSRFGDTPRTVRGQRRQ